MAAIFERAGLGTAADFERAGADRLDARPSSTRRPEDARGLPVSGYVCACRARPARRARSPRWSSASSQPSALDLRAEAAARKLSLREVVTLASLIEKETAAPEERPLVSAVYRQSAEARHAAPVRPDRDLRADAGAPMARQPDAAGPSVQLAVQHLPVRGIAAGSDRVTWRAVAARPPSVPPTCPYLYFVSRNDGTHVFATTLAEHNRNVQQWQVRYFQRAPVGNCIDDLQSAIDGLHRLIE